LRISQHPRDSSGDLRADSFETLSGVRVFVYVDDDDAGGFEFVVRDPLEAFGDDHVDARRAEFTKRRLRAT